MTSSVTAGPTRLQDYLYMRAFMDGPLDAEQRREARAAAGVNPTGGWMDGCLEWCADHVRMQLTIGGRAYVAWCEWQGYPDGPIHDDDTHGWETWLAGFIQGYTLGVG